MARKGDELAIHLTIVTAFQIVAAKSAEGSDLEDESVDGDYRQSAALSCSRSQVASACSKR